MFIERKINPSTGAVELWSAHWENHAGTSAKKVLIEKIGDEQPVDAEADGTPQEKAAICWAYGRTLGAEQLVRIVELENPRNLQPALLQRHATGDSDAASPTRSGFAAHTAAVPVAPVGRDRP